MKKRTILTLLIALLAVSSVFASSGLAAGAALRPITPTSDMYPMTWGSGNRGFAFIGALEDIYLRVIALSGRGEDASPEEAVLIIGFDTGKGPYPPGMIELLSKETGVRKENIFWSTTHTHSTPEITNADWKDYLDMEIRHGTRAEELAGLSLRNKARWGVMIEKQLVEAAKEALSSLQPAEIALGTTTSWINVNRDTQYASNLVQNPYDPFGEKIPGTLEGFNGQGASDKTLTVIEIRNSVTKDPIAFITHYAMHNVLLYANDYFNPAFNSAHGVKIAGEDDIETGVYDPDNVENTVLSGKLEFNMAYAEPYKKNFRSITELDTAFNTDGETAANAAIHPDVGGLVSQYIERKYPGTVAIWMSGAAGDQNPVLRNTFNFESPYTGEVLEIPVDGGFIESAVYYASIQFVDVQRAIKRIEEEDAFGPGTPVRILWGSSSVDPIDELYYAAGSTEGVPYPEIPLFMTMLSIGDITLAGVPNEPFNAIGVAVRDNSDLGGAPKRNTLMVDHVWTHPEENSYRSYYPDDVAILNNSHRWGRTVKYPAGVINDAYISLLERLWEEAPEV